MKTKWFSLIAITMAASHTLAAADSKPAAQYRLQIHVRESTRDNAYSMLIQPGGGKGLISVGTRVPYYSFSAKSDAKEVHMLDIGTTIECSARDAEGGLQLECGLNTSTIGKASASVGFPPEVHSRQTRVNAVIPLGSEVTLVDLDDQASGKRLQFAVTAEKLR